MSPDIKPDDLRRASRERFKPRRFVRGDERLVTGDGTHRDIAGSHEIDEVRDAGFFLGTRSEDVEVAGGSTTLGIEETNPNRGETISVFEKLARGLSFKIKKGRPI